MTYENANEKCATIPHFCFILLHLNFFGGRVTPLIILSSSHFRFRLLFFDFDFFSFRFRLPFFDFDFFEYRFRDEEPPNPASAVEERSQHITFGILCGSDIAEGRIEPAY